MGTHDIFICFSSKDESVARAAVQFLEARQLPCWLSSRDVGPGENFQEAIVEAIQAARVIVFLFSESSNKSAEIKKELALAGSFGIPVIPLRLSAIAPTGALRYELATRQWIDIFPHLEPALGKAVDAINQVLHPAGNSRTVDEPAPVARGRADRDPLEARPPAPMTDRRPLDAPIVARHSAEFEAISVLLARNIGPIAKVFVEKASADARTIDELCERLSMHVRTPADRAAFLKAAQAQLSALRTR